MTTYKVYIVQCTTVTIEADSADSAEKIALDAYNSGDTNSGVPEVTDIEEVNP